MNLHEDAAGATSKGDGAEAPPTFRPVVRPGDVLQKELAALSVSLQAFARHVALPTSDVTRIVNGQRRLTARMALHLAHWFGTEPEFWLNLQAQYDLALAERESGEAVRRLPTKETPMPPPRRRGRGSGSG